MKIVFLCLGLAALAAAKSYEGYKLYHVYPTVDSHVQTMHGFMQDPELDFWTERTKLGEKSTVLMKSDYFEAVIRPVLDLNNIEFQVDERDIQGNIERERQEIADRPETYVFNSNKFNTFDEIVAWMVDKNDECVTGHPEFTCSLTSLGQTHEGKDILLFSIKGNGLNRKAYWMDSLIHAREWLAGATLLKMMENFLENFDGDSGVSSILNKYDMYFLPVMNPDGYIYTQTDRYWRKNRSPNANCVGTDLNRNYDYNWGLEGVSLLPCAGTYCGSAASSELETVAVQNIATTLRNDVLGWWTIHAYGEYWMWPWGNTYTFDGQAPGDCEIATDDDDMRWVGQPSCDACSHVNNDGQDCRRASLGWKVGTSCETIYPTTGATDDYVKGALGIKYPICVEVTGDDFIVPVSDIPYSFNEVWAGVKENVDRIAAREGLP